MRTEGARWLHALRSLEASLGHGIEGGGPGQDQQHLPTEDIGRWPSSQEMVTMVTNSPFWEWNPPPHSPTTATDVVWPAHSGSKPAVRHWRPVKIRDLSRTLCSPGRGNMARVFGTQPSELESRVLALPVNL